MEAVWKQKRVWICLSLAVVTLALYAQVRQFDFIDLDDGEYIFENWHVISGLSVTNVVWAFTAGHASNWHPLTWMSHMLDCQVFGLGTGYHHLVNVLFHVANTCLLFLVLLRMTGAMWRSAFVAALFAWHPLHVESVAWIAERKDVLSTFFLFLTVHAYASYVRRPEKKRYLLTLLCFAMGLMAKPMLVTLPFVLLLIDYWPLHRLSPAVRGNAGPGKTLPIRALKQSARALIREKIPFLLLATVSSCITFLVQKAGGAVKPIDALPLGDRVANAILSYAGYLAKTVWPSDLSVYYRYVLPGPGFSEVAVIAFVLICVTILAVRFASRAPYLITGWFWYLGTLVPVIGFVQVGGQAMADRYTYTPLIGIFIIIAWGVPDIVPKWAGAKIALAALAAAVLLSCSVATWFQVRYWRDTVSLFSHTLAIDKDSYLAHYLMGTGLARRGKYMEAVDHFFTALRLQPTETSILGNLGSSLYQAGRTQEAIEQFAKGLKTKPDDPFLLRNMGRIRFDQGKYREAVDYLTRAQQLKPDDFMLVCSLADALSKVGRLQEAIDAYHAALRMQPSYPEALFGLGVVQAGQGKLPEAAHNLEEALRLAPGYAEAHNNLGNVLLQQGQVDKALWHYSEAIHLKPEYAEAHYNKGVVLHSQGKVTEATAEYREAIRLKSDYVDAFYNLASALEGQGDATGAIANFLEAIRLRPDFVEAYNNLGVAYYKQGQIQKALDAFSGALRINPENADARRNYGAIAGTLGKPKK
jgi:protein O-mannosyl-transferase